jgi:PKD repeat protein
VTTFNPGTGNRLAVADLGACYPAGTTIYLNSQVYASAFWSGHYKNIDIYVIASDNLTNLAAAEAAVDAGGTGYIFSSAHLFTADSTTGAELIMNVSNSASTPLTSTSRYISVWAKPRDFPSVNWYTNDASTLALGTSGVGGASSVSCPVYAPVADFSASDTNPAIGVTITFTDLSTNTPTSWAWTFGDGGTSTSQNPTHAYSAAGTYAVSLTATNAAGSDIETKLTYIHIFTDESYVPPSPAGVLLEIYAAAPGASRWGLAKWGEPAWSSAGWRDVTPYGVTVNIDWGSNRATDGILSVPTAASWSVDFYDPGRILDPSNRDGPYFGDLAPYLPIRVSHRGVVVRQGYATGITHNYIPAVGRNGYIAATDNVSRLANAKVPSDTTLPNTLYARAAAAISAAGLSINVASPLGTDPAVTAWVTGTREWSVWQWITDAAQDVLYIPIVDKVGTVTFRPWATPLARGRTVDATELIDLGVITDYEGMYSVVQARQDVSTIVERALTPPPRYGARTYTRNEITLNPGTWADTVLADRALGALRWQPGDIYPLTADSVELYSSVEAVERLGISDLYTDPAVIVDGIVVGGSIFIQGKLNGLAIWRFNFNVAQTATEPLIETGGDATDYLFRTGGGEYLYPTGSG